VNRKELIAAVAGKAGVAEADTDKVLAAFQDVVFDVVADGKDKLSLPGFLTSNKVPVPPARVVTPPPAKRFRSRRPRP